MSLLAFDPALLHHQLGLAGLLDSGKPSRNIAYMQGLGHVADIVRVWGWAPRSTKRCKYRQKLLCQALGCCSVRFAFAVAGSRAARSLLFSRWFSGLLARERARATPATKRCYLRCVVACPFPAWLAGCCFFGVLWRARACDPMSAFWFGSRLGPRKLASHLGLGVGNMHTRPEAAGPENT